MKREEIALKILTTLMLQGPRTYEAEILAGLTRFSFEIADMFLRRADAEKLSDEQLKNNAARLACVNKIGPPGTLSWDYYTVGFVAGAKWALKGEES